MDVQIQESDKILVVAPHADDESIGCGGLLALYGKQCDLMLLTDGRKGHTTEAFSDECELIQIRKNEFRKAAEIADVANIIFLDIEDGTVAKNKKMIYKQDIRIYDYIFVPNRHESHVDHRVVLSVFRKMKRKQRAKAKLFEYEVWTPLRHATWFLDISDVVSTKRQMINQHVSQLADINYTEKGLALSCYRGAFNNTNYSEAYCLADFDGIKKMLYPYLPPKLKAYIKAFIGRNNE